MLTDVNVGVFAGPASGFVAVRPRLTGCLGAGGPLFQNLADALVQLAASGYGGTTVSLTSGAVVGPGCGFTLQTSSFQGGSPVVTVELYGYLTRAPR